MQKFAPLFFLLFFSASLFAQQDESFSRLDSTLTLLQSRSEWAKALPIGLEALRLHEQKFGKDSSYCDRLFTQGLLHFRLFAYEEAYRYWKENKQLAFALLGENHPKSAKAINALSLVVRDLGDLAESERLGLKNKEIRAAVFGKKHPEYAKALSNQGNLYQEMRRFDEAEALFLEAIDIWANTIGKQTYDYTGALNNLAIVYFTTGQCDKAENLWLETKELRALALGKKHPQYAVVVENLGNARTCLKDYTKAEAYYLEALKIYAEILGKENPEYARNLSNLGHFYLGLDLYAKAETYYQQAAQILEKTLSSRDIQVLSSLHSQAILYGRTGRQAQQWAYCLRAIAQNAGKDSISARIDANWVKELASYDYAHYDELHKCLLLIFELLSKEPAAEKQLLVAELAMETAKQRRDRVSDMGDKLRILQATAQWVNRALEVLQKEQKNDPGSLSRAFRWMETAKSALLADAFQTEKAYALGDLPDSLAQKERYLQKRIVDLKAAIVAGEKTPEKIDSLRSLLNDENAGLKILRQEIETKYPKYAALKYSSKLARPEEIQALLDDKTAILEYAFSDRSLFVFYMDQKQMRLQGLAADSLSGRVADLRQALTDYESIQKHPEEAYERFVLNAHWFYQNIVEPALQNTEGIEHLVIIPDGELAHLPFEVFLTKAAPQNGSNYNKLPYLLQRYAISYLYSAGMMLENANKSKEDPTDGKILAMAGQYTPIEEGSPQEKLRSPKSLILRKELGDLPQALNEVHGLEQRFAGEFFQGSQAAEAQFKRQIHQPYSVLHLAMHGVLDKNDPLLSCIAFTENGDSTEDNLLYAYEVSQMQLPFRLVVLSACETGYGKFARGEGVLSLARSFMYAGTPSLVMTLWEVNDVGAEALMRGFYQELAAGKDKAHALRQSKLDYLETSKGIAAHPAYWSPFVLLGDAAPIRIKQKSRFGLWAAVAAGGLLLLGLGLYRRRPKK